MTKGLVITSHGTVRLARYRSGEQNAVALKLAVLSFLDMQDTNVAIAALVTEIGLVHASLDL